MLWSRSREFWKGWNILQARRLSGTFYLRLRNPVWEVKKFSLICAAFSAFCGETIRKVTKRRL